MGARGDCIVGGSGRDRGERSACGQRRRGRAQLRQRGSRGNLSLVFRLGRVHRGVFDDVWAATRAPTPVAATRSRSSPGTRNDDVVMRQPVVVRAVMICALLGATTLFLANARKNELPVTR